MHAASQTLPSQRTAFYPVSEAARLVGLRSDRLRRWVRGYEYASRDGAKKRAEPLVTSDVRGAGREMSISFADLIEARFVKMFLDHGVTMPTIRAVARSAEQLFETKHPFCVKRFETDGETILARLQSDDPRGGERLIDLKRSHLVFPEVFNPLLKTLDYDASDEVVRWWPRGRSQPILLDAERAFGEPILDGSLIPTRVLYGAHRGGQSIASIADWYGITRSAVEAAIAFEQTVRPARRS